MFKDYFVNSYNWLKGYLSHRKLNKWFSQIGEVSIVIGMPGTGKTTLCAYFTKLCLDADFKIFSNVPILGATPFEADEIGKYDMSNALILIDEGSLDYDNRNFSTNFNKDSLSYLKLARHRNNHFLILSQSVDIDIKWVRMARSIFQLKRGVLGTSLIYPIKRTLDINDETHKFEDNYYKPRGLVAVFLRKRLFRFLYYKLFDSYDAPDLPDFPARLPYSSTSKPLKNSKRKSIL